MGFRDKKAATPVSSKVWLCGPCQKVFPHEAALNEHRVTSFCDPVYSQAKVRPDPKPWQRELAEEMGQLRGREPMTAGEIRMRELEYRVNAEVRMLSGMLADQRRHIEALEKKAASLTPRVVAAERAKLDYTQMHSEDEDGLEDGYRGWPTPKERKVF